MSLSSLHLHSNLLQAVEQLDYRQATAIQQQAIPEILAGKDVLAGAQTGTGKTAAFALPILHRLLEQEVVAGVAPRVLILTPTRELTQQVYQSLVLYAQFTEIRIVQAYGGVSIRPQIAAINDGVDIMVATPGRLLDLIYNEYVSLAAIDVLVLDEADRMLDLGFKDEINRIVKHLPESRQSLLFSATLNDDIFALSQRFLHKPSIIEVAARNTAADTVEQLIYTVDADQKRGLCSYLIGSKNWQQVLIFTRTKQQADTLASEMGKDGLKCAAIHGDKSQGARDRALQQFKAGEVRVLVATDVAARGLDIKQLNYVINYELPYNAEDYIHRIGRTGRAGSEGLAISLVSDEEQYLAKEIETLLGKPLLQQWFPGFEPDPDKVPENKKTRNKATGKKRAREQALGIAPKKKAGGKGRPRR